MGEQRFLAKQPAPARAVTSADPAQLHEPLAVFPRRRPAPARDGSPTPDAVLPRDTSYPKGVAPILGIESPRRRSPAIRTGSCHRRLHVNLSPVLSTIPARGAVLISTPAARHSASSIATISAADPLAEQLAQRLLDTDPVPLHQRDEIPRPVTRQRRFGEVSVARRKCSAVVCRLVRLPSAAGYQNLPPDLRVLFDHHHARPQRLQLRWRTSARCRLR